MKHVKTSLLQAAQARLERLETVWDGLTEKVAALTTSKQKAMTYPLKSAFVKTFATSGYPFLTFYEFNDLAGWCRDTYFAPDNVPGYAEDIGKRYTVWTHEAVSYYRRHIILDQLEGNIDISFEIPSLDAKSWFPLRIRVFDRNGLYFQTDQKLVVEAIKEDRSMITAWTKVPQLQESLPRLHAVAARSE